MTDMHKISAPTAPLPRPRPSRGGRRTIVISVLVAALVVGGAALVYSRTRNNTSSSAPANPTYCELSAQLGGLLAGVGVPPAGAAPASVRPAAIKKVLTQMGGRIDELQKVAPSTISGAVKTFITALKQAAAGNASRIRSPGFVEAERSIVGFLQTAPCQRAGSPAGDGTTG